MSSHDTHDSENTSDYSVPKSRSSSTAAYLFSFLLIGLFIAALSFIDVMGNGEHKKENEPTKEATSNETLKGESGEGRAKSETTQFRSGATVADSTQHGGQQ